MIYIRILVFLFLYDPKIYVLWLNYMNILFVAYCVVAVESAGRQLPLAFLERIKEDFTKKYGGGKASTAGPNGLKKEFG